MMSKPPGQPENGPGSGIWNDSTFLANAQQWHLNRPPTLKSIRFKDSFS